MVPSRVMDRDRTYGSAVALREWLDEHDVAVQSVNVMTEDAHARRTHLLFKKALVKNVTVGIIAVPNPDYDARRWWRYSEGVKDVGSEAFAYIYTRFFFYPSEPPNVEKPAVPLRAIPDNESSYCWPGLCWIAAGDAICARRFASLGLSILDWLQAGSGASDTGGHSRTPQSSWDLALP